MSHAYSTPVDTAFGMPVTSTTTSKELIVGWKEIITGKTSYPSVITVIIDLADQFIPQVIQMEKDIEGEREVWLKQAQQYLSSLSEEELAWLKLTEQSLQNAWGEEDDIWDKV